MINTDLNINGKAETNTTTSKMIQAFFNKDILQSSGGYILTYKIHKYVSYLGIMPSIIAGQRSNHYDLKTGPVTEVFLTGGINTNGEISLIYKITKEELTEKIKSELKELYISFANLLKKNGYEGDGTYDWITVKIIEESQLFLPIPSTIFDLPPALSLSS
ncbi:MAG: hypothetical protein PF693_10125 [Spirochaetia bacterium]|jgi:hypothetical protein|nr:hypothetical protein [Spirochaetia bacterium]